MADKTKDQEPKRLNRAVGVGEALSGVLDQALKKRGFATRDILTNWAAMAPKPYGALAMPDQLKWPRGAGYEGATLYLRCAPGHALALTHDAPLIVAAVNRYFGYLLVREVRLSAEPMGAPPRKAAVRQAPSAEISTATAEAVAEIGNPALKDALRALGEEVLGKGRQRRGRGPHPDVTKA